MVNYNLVNDRNEGMKKIPRLSFMTPTQQNTGGNANSGYINFCQTGCQLEFFFNNIPSCMLNNNGTFFSISPSSENRSNYVLWNGTTVDGLEMTPFYLKDIYFGLPAKDKVNAEFVNQTIQYYFCYVNESYSNLMICISIIGQANMVLKQMDIL